MSTDQPQLSWPFILGLVTDGHGSDRRAGAVGDERDHKPDAATSAQIARFGLAVKMKGAAPEELNGLAEAMLEHAKRVQSRPRRLT